MKQILFALLPACLPWAAHAQIRTESDIKKMCKSGTVNNPKVMDNT